MVFCSIAGPNPQLSVGSIICVFVCVFRNGRVRDRKMWAVGKVGVSSRMEMVGSWIKNRNGAVRDMETLVARKVGVNSRFKKLNANRKPMC